MDDAVDRLCDNVESGAAVDPAESLARRVDAFVGAQNGTRLRRRGGHYVLRRREVIDTEPTVVELEIACCVRAPRPTPPYPNHVCENYQLFFDVACVHRSYDDDADDQEAAFGRALARYGLDIVDPTAYADEAITVHVWTPGDSANHSDVTP